jgi:hypothetical protein
VAFPGWEDGFGSLGSQAERRVFCAPSLVSNKCPIYGKNNPRQACTVAAIYSVRSGPSETRRDTYGRFCVSLTAKTGSSPLGSANDFKALEKISDKGDMLYGKCTAWTVLPLRFAGKRFLLFAGAHRTRSNRSQPSTIDTQPETWSPSDHPERRWVRGGESRPAHLAIFSKEPTNDPPGGRHPPGPIGRAHVIEHHGSYITGRSSSPIT